MPHIVVIGAGLAGAATAWQLTRRGHRVTVLERTTPANEFGSSHGSARILRYAYPDPLYVQLVVDARVEWDALERESGRQLVTPTGALDHGVVRNPRQLAEILTAAGVENELLSADEATARWPQLTFDSEVLWHPDAGVLDADLTVHTMLELAEASGLANIHTNFEVASVERVADSYRVHSSTGESVDAERIVVAAGAWLPTLLPKLPLPAEFAAAIPPLEIWQEQAFHFAYRDERDFAVDPADAEPWPTFVHMTDEITTYGLPGGRDDAYRGHKIAEFQGGKRIASAATQDGRVVARGRARVSDYVADYVPGVDAERIIAERTCLFTSTPTEDFLIDEVDGIVLLSACSGHGAKFGPLLGAFGANLATGEGRVPDRFRVMSEAHRSGVGTVTS